MSQTLSIIIPTLNSAKIIRKCLSSIYSQSYPKHLYEVILVDDGSSDDTYLIAKKYFPQIKVIRFYMHKGCAPALTVGTKYARNEYILVTNDDVIFDPHCFRNLLQLAERSRRYGIVTGKMLYLNKPHRLAIPGFRINHYFGYHPYDLENSDTIRECEYAPGACILIKRKLLIRLGYFDNAYIYCGEDYDICFQVRKAGFKIMYNPNAIFYHGFYRSLTKRVKNSDVFFAHYRGKIRYILKNGTVLQICSTIFLQLIVGPVYTYFFHNNNTIIPLVKALLWNLINLRKTFISRHIANQLAKKFSYETVSA